MSTSEINFDTLDQNLEAAFDLLDELSSSTGRSWIPSKNDTFLKEGVKEFKEQFGRDPMEHELDAIRRRVCHPTVLKGIIVDHNPDFEMDDGNGRVSHNESILVQDRHGETWWVTAGHASLNFIFDRYARAYGVEDERVSMSELLERDDMGRQQLRYRTHSLANFVNKAGVSISYLGKRDANDEKSPHRYSARFVWALGRDGTGIPEVMPDPEPRRPKGAPAPAPAAAPRPAALASVAPASQADKDLALQIAQLIARYDSNLAQDLKERQSLPESDPNHVKGVRKIVTTADAQRTIEYLRGYASKIEGALKPEDVATFTQLVGRAPGAPTVQPPAPAPEPVYNDDEEPF